MRAFILSLLLATSAHAAIPIPKAHYNITTGNVTIKDIPGGIDYFTVQFPARYSLIDEVYNSVLLYGWNTDGTHNSPNGERYLDRIHPATRHAPGAAYLSTWMSFKNRFGFPTEMNLGEIMVPGAVGWEDDFFDSRHNGRTDNDSSRYWNNTSVLGHNGWEYAPWVTVPEPTSLAILFVGLMFTAGRRRGR
jgi:hypothetical protein